MKTIVLKEGDYVVNPKKEFEKLSDSSTLSGLKMAVQPFLVITENDLILLDAGLGVNQVGKNELIEKINENGYDSGDITKVLISHLHKDHIAGIGHFNGTKYVSNFPNAAIYIQGRELEFALSQTDSPSYDINVLRHLSEFSGLELLHNNVGNISPEIFYEVSSGHTPFHQVFWIKTENETVFYGGDDLPQHSYLDLPIAYKTDFDGRKAMESRKKWEQRAKENHWKLLFYHDMHSPVVQF